VDREIHLHGQDDDAFLEWLQKHLGDSDTEQATDRLPHRLSGPRRRIEHRRALVDGGEAFDVRRFDDRP